MDNNKHLTILSILFVTFDSILLLVSIGFFIGFPLLGKFIGDATANMALSYIGVGVGSVLLVISIPAIIAGVGLVYRKAWSRILALIICVIKLFNLPFGTALGVYGIWVLMQDETIELLKK